LHASLQVPIVRGTIRGEPHNVYDRVTINVVKGDETIQVCLDGPQAKYIEEMWNDHPDATFIISHCYDVNDGVSVRIGTE
jgi:hypothetical protein